MIGTNGKGYTFFYFTDYIEICQSRFYHYDISTFFFIHNSFFYGLYPVGTVHLISFLIAKPWCGIQCITEWAIKTGSIFCTVRHNAGFREIIFLQCFTYGANPTIHHIAWSHKVCPCFCMTKAHFYQRFNSFIIYYFPVFYNTIMPVR